jgi:3-dehydroquinate synthetase
LKSLKKREIISGYAEILKHAVIHDKNFFNWLKFNSKNIFLKYSKELIYAIKKSCKIKLFYVNKDTNEKNLRMTLNFGHTFAHAIEIKNNYSKNITHGEAVLSGMILATKLSVIKKVCNKKTLEDLVKIYNSNNLNYTFEKYRNINKINNLIPYLKNDKKNNDEKINFILLNKIGKAAKPNKYKVAINQLKKDVKQFTRY